MTFQQIKRLATETWKTFSATNGASRGAAIAFYTVTSIAPVLLIVIAVAGLVFGKEAASGALFGQFRSLLGSEGADFLQKAIASASSKSAGIAATVISLVTLLATASGVFLELEDALNSMWGVKPQGGLKGMARSRVASVGLIVALGFLLMVSLVVDTAMKGLSGFINAYLPFGAAILVMITLLISFALVTVLFAAILKYLPAKQLSWRDVIWGAAFTALLFEVGKFLIGLYLAKSSTISSLGAAGALLALLFWVYYTGQIFLFGAAFTRIYAQPAPAEVAGGASNIEAKPSVDPRREIEIGHTRLSGPKRRVPLPTFLGIIVWALVASKFSGSHASSGNDGKRPSR
jgi:membrane protein